MVSRKNATRKDVISNFLVAPASLSVVTIARIKIFRKFD